MLNAHINKPSVRQSFARSAHSYDQAASLQRNIGERLIQQLEHISINPRIIMDLGCGTGWAVPYLTNIFPAAKIIGIDFALPMLQRASDKLSTAGYICADAERLPIRYQCVDLIYANAVLQWCNDQEAVFNELRKILTCNGVLIFTTFGPDTLKELRQSWSQADGYAHVSSFASFNKIQEQLNQAGFVNVTLQQDFLHIKYAQVYDLMRDLQNIGARNATYGRAKGLTGKKRLIAMLNAYEVLRQDNLLPATYEILYALAWN